MEPGLPEGSDDEYLEPGETVDPEDMDSMIDQYLDQMSGELVQGQLLTVPVVAIKTDHLLVDLGEKSEGIIDLREFPRIDDKLIVKIGDPIDVVVKGYDPDSGLIHLSYQEARRRKALTGAREALDNHQPIKGRVIRTVKGGLILDIGTTAFLPASQIDLRRVENFEEWVGREVEGYVIEFTPAKRRIIISRRQLLEARRDLDRKAVLEKIHVGQTIEGAVKRIVEFGAFIDLGSGIDGLVPRSEVSWNRNAKPEDYLTEGERVEVQVIEVDHENGKVTLSRRMARPNPWDTAAERYPVHSTIAGTVVSITDYGAFVRLEEGLDGMIHVSDMSWDTSNRRPRDYVASGQEVTAIVLNVDPKAQRMSLGLKQLTNDPWEDIESRFPKGSRLKGKVTGLTKYGAFVELEPGIEGMIHISDFSWEKRIGQPRDVVQKGQDLEVVILEIDREKHRIALGVKQLSASPFEMFMGRFSVGDAVEGEVVNVTEFGIFVKLADGVEGFIHVSQIDRERVGSPNDLFKSGDKVTAKITRIDPETQKISLSRRQMIRDEERKTLATYMNKKRDGSLINMGELMEDIVLEDDLPKTEEPAPTRPQPSPEPKQDPEPMIAEVEPIFEEQPPAMPSDASPAQVENAKPEPQEAAAEDRTRSDSAAATDEATESPGEPAKSADPS